MKRFYKRAMDTLKDELKLDELHDDIQDYVGYMEHSNNVLISEVARLQPQNDLVKRMVGK